MEKPTHIFGHEIDWVGLEQIGWNDFVEYCDFNGIGSDPEDYEVWLDCWISSRRAMHKGTC